jgi:hypothetical protein
VRYFAEQVRAVRIDSFQFGKHKVFEVSYKKAQDLYHRHVKEYKHDGMANEEDVKALFERGQFVNIHKMGLLIYGKDLSDSELFKQRLEGKIEQEVWK